MWTALSLVFHNILVLEVCLENMMKFDRYKIWVPLIKAGQSGQSSCFNYMGVGGPGNFGK